LQPSNTIDIQHWYRMKIYKAYSTYEILPERCLISHLGFVDWCLALHKLQKLTKKHMIRK